MTAKINMGPVTQQLKHVLIQLHVIVLLVAAVQRHLVTAAAREPALKPVRTRVLDGSCYVVRGRELTPVEDVQPLCSFTVDTGGFFTVAQQEAGHRSYMVSSLGIPEGANS